MNTKSVKNRRVMLQSPYTHGSDLFERVRSNPILTPTNLWWESEAVFNPGVVLGDDGITHILYRAIGRDGISRFGYARSRDGEKIDYRSKEPVFEPDEGNEFERFGVEDPRLVKVNGYFYVTYAAASKYKVTGKLASLNELQDKPWRVRISLAVTKDFVNFTRHGVVIQDMDNKDAVLFPDKINGKYVILHRLPPDIWVAYSDDLRDWRGHQKVTHTRPGEWDERRIGAGAPPVRVNEGWLLMYHGSDHHNVYRAGFLLLDANDPSKVLGRSSYPAFSPREKYEKEGLVPNVVFPQGLVLREDQLWMYYGGADKVVGLAIGSLKSILASLK